nr:RHS repeat-associated core domain-containing protein [Agromyces subbeticus]
MSTNGVRVRERLMLVIAGALVVVLGVDPGMLGAAWTWAAQATTGGVIDESRAQNLAAAETALGTQTPDASNQVVGADEDPTDPLDPLALPADLPTAAEETVDLTATPLPEDGVPAELGGMSVTVAPASGAESPDRVSLKVLDQVATEEAGVTGVLLEVTDASDAPAPDDQAVELTVAYDAFAGVGGGDWASRLQAMWVPDCDVDADGTPECRPVALESTHDEAAQTVRITVPVNPASSGWDAAPATLRTTTTMGPTAATSPSSSSGSVAVTSGAAGPLGDWSATPLALSSTWGTSGATGAFTWAYPMRAPQVPAGPAPELSLSYSSAVSDGRIPSTNNQAGLIGEGFDIGTSFIERSYKTCADDETSGANNIDLSAPDLCWGPENATLSLNGSGTELVKDQTSGTWHPRRDDGTRIEHLTSGGAEGEHWKVTTTDGTQYFFGRDADAASAWTVPVYSNHPGEPDHATAFKDSSREHVWRWNLDRVIDPSGNTLSYFYTSEVNHYRPFYGTAPVSYVAGGYLNRVEYGTHPDDSVSQAPAKVEFTHGPRCITDLALPDSWCSNAQTATTANHWPDTPVDLICASGAECKTYAPTFFNRTRLSKITTSASDGSVYQSVDSWTLSQRFVPQGSGIDLQPAKGIMLRLDAITHTGNGGPREDLSLPEVRFDYIEMKNRVEDANTGADAFWRHRVRSVRTESGGRISVNYATGCQNSLPADPAENKDLCFPVKWHHPNESEPRTDYFYKHVVDSVVEGHTNLEPGTSELITGSVAVTTRYDYAAADWKWVEPDSPLIDDDDKTFSEFRGAKQITTRTGETGTQQTKAVTTYYRGTGATLTAPIAGVDSVTDSEPLAGQVFTSTQYNGETAKVSETVTRFGTPDTVATSAAEASFTATRIPSEETHSAAYDADGELEHHTRTTTEFNKHSQPTKVDDRGDLGTSDDDLCATTTYAHETDSGLAAKHLVALPAVTETVAKKCNQDVDRPADVVSASKLSYDASGRPTMTETIDPRDGDGYIQTATVKYDTRGRVLETTDAAGQTTTTAYTPRLEGPVTATTTTNPLGHTTTTKLDPFLGVPVESIDANGRTTKAVYDALGRLTKVWYPQHADITIPSVQYEYTVQSNGLNAVVTKTISADGKRQHSSAVLYDPLMRPFQTQQEGRGTGHGQTEQGRMVTHTRYDSTGRIIEQTEPSWVQSAVSATPEVKPADTSGHTTFEYDDAGRQTAQVFWIHTDSEPTHEKWRTTTSYDGATILQIPPMGGTPTATKVDARGRTIELTQYPRDPDTDAEKTSPSDVRALPGTTTTKYAYDAAGRLTSMTDPPLTDGAPPNEWSYGYDWAGRQITASDPDAGTSTTSYDVLGRVTTRTNGNNQALGYTYDALGRTTSVRDGSPTGTVRASWEYDTVLKGVLTSATRIVDGQSYVTRTDDWDTGYRPTQTSLVLPNTGTFTNLQTRTLSKKYEYAIDGQTTKVTHPAVVDAAGKTVLGAEAVTTVYDAASSMPSWMSSGFGWGTYVTASRYAADGRPLLTDLGNTYGAAVSYQYEDGTKRLSGISLDRERIDGTELDLQYGYDPAGNVTSITDAPTSTPLSGASFQDNQCFNYDGLARLQTAWTAGNGDCAQAPSAGAMGGAAPYWSNYTHDVLGNRTKETTTSSDGTATTTTNTHGAGAGPHAVTTATTAGTPTTYEYDAAGNRTSVKVGTDSPTEYVWDAEGELTAAGGTSNVYDADGNRIIRTDANGTTVYAGGQEIHINPDDTVTATRYYMFAGSTVAIRTDRGLGNGVTSHVTDHHGTPIAAIPNGGHPTNTTITRLYTDPFGAARGESDGQTIPGDTQFLGKTRDETTGLTQIGARYYDEATGGFISVDPLLDLTDPQQWNAYAYAGNSPISRSDPSGLLALGATDYMDEYGKPMGTKGVQDTWSVTGATPTYTVSDVDYLASNPTWQAPPPTEYFPPERTGPASPQDEELFWQGTRGILGTVPVIGAPFDVLDGIVCASEGDWLCVLLDGVGIVPVVGDIGAALGKSAKFAAAGADAAKTADDIAVGFRSDTSHIFRDARGHLAEDTAENRALIQSALDPNNLRSTVTLKNGESLAKYFKTQPDGTQVWAEVRNGEITNGGLNVIPR